MKYKNYRFLHSLVLWKKRVGDEQCLQEQKYTQGSALPDTPKTTICRCRSISPRSGKIPSACRLIHAGWQAQVNAYRAAHPRMPMASMTRQDAGQLAQGVDTKAPMQPLPRSILASKEFISQ